MWALFLQFLMSMWWVWNSSFKNWSFEDTQRTLYHIFFNARIGQNKKKQVYCFPVIQFLMSMWWVWNSSFKNAQRMLSHRIWYNDIKIIKNNADFTCFYNFQCPWDDCEIYEYNIIEKWWHKLCVFLKIMRVSKNHAVFLKIMMVSKNHAGCL